MSKTLDINITLIEGPKVLVNWTQNFNQPKNIINSLKGGDKLTVLISGLGPGTNCQLRISWGDGEDQYVNWNNIYSNGTPYSYELELTKDQVISIKESGKLYLNGCNITIGKWTLTQKKIVSKERGNASTIIWSGSQVIDWSVSPKTLVKIANSEFTEAMVGMKLRMNFSNMKLGAQGRISSSNGTAIPDANTYEKLPSDWGDYYEFIITNDMLTELKVNGMNITGVGYTLKSVELIDPMKEYIILANFNNDDIKAWEPGEGIPKLSVKLSNYEEQEITTTVSASLMTDMFKDYNNYSVNVTLGAGETKSIDLKFEDLKPGFYRMAAKVNFNSICTYYIGYDPTNIVSPNDAQPDFWTFWDDWKIALEKININPEMDMLNDISKDSYYVYVVKIMSIPDKKGGKEVPIWGYYAEPKAEGNYPCIINFHGTDNGSGLPSVPDIDNNKGWCIFNLSLRGQMLSRIKNGNDYKVNGETDFYSYGLGNNDEHYYRAAYLDTIRALDFVYSRKKVNKNAIFASGGSQGGCLTYVCAGLSDGRIKAIAPCITGHSDFVHTMEIVDWPTNKFNNWINNNYPDNYQEGKAALLAHQSYFDTKNFSSRITCPVITNFSLQDNTDGPHLNISPYNLLINVSKEDKRYSINQFLGHSAKSDWEKEYMSFFEYYIDKEVINMSEYNYDTYFNSTAVQLPFGMKGGIITNINTEKKMVIINWLYNGDDQNHNIIPGGTAVIINSNSGNYKLLLLPDNKEEPPKENLLHGTNIRTSTTNGDIYYKLKSDFSSTDKLNQQFGWHYGADNGASFIIEDHKAWLALTNQQASNIDFFTFEGI